MEKKNRAIGALVGLAVGDAVGTTVEFKQRGTFEPVTDMVGGGPFNLKVGQWTDDTSMALCLAQSLIEKGFDLKDQMNKYLDWYKNGYMSSTGECFDIGNTTIAALRSYMLNGNPMSGDKHFSSSGNGSIMRLAPVPIFYHGADSASAASFSADSSKTTHGSQFCVESCHWLGETIHILINKDCRGAIDDVLSREVDYPYCPEVENVISNIYDLEDESCIRGSGFVIQSLEAAKWAFSVSNSFEDAILKAVNLGDDADTTAAICGQLAGAYYGYTGIPQKWLDKLYNHDMIVDIGTKLYEHGQ